MCLSRSEMDATLQDDENDDNVLYNFVFKKNKLKIKMTDYNFKNLLRIHYTCKI